MSRRMDDDDKRVIRTEDLPGPFQLEIPEIYQLETAYICNFHCPMCIREKVPRKDKQDLLPVNLVKKLVAENAFRGSYFVELQMAGEPCLHPKLAYIISILKDVGVKVGLSTNGFDLNTEGLLELDYITISLDSLDHYKEIRVGSQKTGEEFVQEILGYIDKAQQRPYPPKIDIQFVKLPGWEKQYEKALRIFEEAPVRMRTVEDCFITKFHTPSTLPVKREPCLNPWLSVSIQANGNVTPCCFTFGDEIILGNIANSSLKDIWHGEAIQTLRREHATQQYRRVCAECYMRSPVLLHWDILRTQMINQGEEPR